ncbi:MAG: hypothetical protein RL722_2684 [Pseudomonadota bacterium]|jgi:hypothetical protein
MQLSAVYLRTAKGDEEIRTRRNALRLLHRQVLFLVDGQATLEAMIKRWGALHGFEEALIHLHEQGYIQPATPTGGVHRASSSVAATRPAPLEPAAAKPPPGVVPAPVPAPVADTLGPAGEEVRTRLLAWISLNLGRQEGRFSTRLRAAPATREGLEQAADACYRLLRLTVDESLAEQWRTFSRSALLRL